MLNVIESEKKAMPNDIANLGWRATAKTRANIGRSHPAAASFQEMPSFRARVLSRPVVAIRMLWTRLAGGSTSSSDFSQRCPSSASASRGPQTAQAWACAWKLSSRLPLNACSTASLNSASNSAHCIPFLLSPGITSPAYRYVEAGAQVPCARGVFGTSLCLREPSGPWQFPDSPGPAGHARPLPPAVPVIASATPDEPFREFRDAARSRPVVRPCLESVHSGADRRLARKFRHPANPSNDPVCSSGNGPPADYG